MTDIRDQIAAIRAQLDRDEQVAKAASSGPWNHGSDGLVWARRPGDPVSGSTEVDDAEHIARWNPERVLAEIRIKRELLDCLVGATGKGTSRLIANDEPWAMSSDDLVKLLAGTLAARTHQLGCSLYGGVALGLPDGGTAWIECGPTVCGHAPRTAGATDGE